MSTWSPTADCPHCGAKGGTGFTHGCVPTTFTTAHQNLPLDKHGGIDQQKLRERLLQSYDTAELEAELKRREAPDA